MRGEAGDYLHFTYIFRRRFVRLQNGELLLHFLDDELLLVAGLKQIIDDPLSNLNVH